MVCKRYSVKMYVHFVNSMITGCIWYFPLFVASESIHVISLQAQKAPQRNIPVSKTENPPPGRVYYCSTSVFEGSIWHFGWKWVNNTSLVDTLILSPTFLVLYWGKKIGKFSKIQDKFGFIYQAGIIQDEHMTPAT